jgi:carboxypeptidase Taq
MENKKLGPKEVCIVREVWREFERDKKLPTAFVEELARVCSKAQTAWEEAKKNSDFNSYLPHLKKIVELKRKEAEIVGYKDSPYDALIDVFEPGTTAKDLSIILDELKDFLIPFLRKIEKSKVKINPKMLKGKFDISRQFEFQKSIIEKIGYKFESGRLDTSVHPFSIGFSPEDVRITTRYSEENLVDSFLSTVHEAGHALYEQGILAENFGTPMGESISLGIHESQSKTWENIIGRSKFFWKYFYPELKKIFPKPFSKIKLDDFYRAINAVEPSLIRIESDELTYNLHIILRFEIEKELVEGSIACEDLPKIWADKMKSYLGVDVPNDAKGVLQDVHWAHGSIGYFPTYILGNLYASQFFQQAKKNIPELESKISKGNFRELREWLNKKIHIHGKLYSAEKLVQKVTGEKLTSKYFVDYIRDKYSKIYKIKL